MPKPTTGKSKGSLSLLVEKGSKNSVQKELSEKKDAGKKRLAEEECISGEEEEEEDDDDEEKDKSNSSDDDNKNENEEGDDDDDDDDDISSVLVKNKKTKKAKTATEEEFAGAMAAILGQSVKSLDKDAPIMAKNKSTEKKIEKEKIEYKARKAITTERKALLSKDRVIPDMRNFEYEKRLRKVATRGVVKLFNAVKVQQTEIKQMVDSKPTITKTEKVSALSKAKFLDLLKSGAK